jgi:hypothetical protein
MVRKVVFAPNTFQGLGLNHPFEIQGIRKIEALFNHSQPFTLQLNEATWHRTMVESGQGADFLETDIEIARNVITSGWVSSLWEFLQETQIKVRRNCKNFHRDFWMTNDSYIMLDILHSKYNRTKDEITIFNNFRLFMQVELVSDIITADGVAIRRHI